MAESYISQFYSWSTGDTVTAARLNGNLTNLISGLQDGDKAINVLKVLGASQQFVTADGSNITLQNVDTYSGKDTITIHKAENDGNPQIILGAGTAERLEINPVYDTGAQTLDYVQFQTKAASATADKGEFRFLVDETAIADINDSGLNLKTGLDFLINDTSVLNATTLGSSVVNSSLTSLGTLTTLTVDNVTINGDDITSSSTLTFTGDVNFDSNTLFVDSTNNNVGIGTASPGTDKLSIAGNILVSAADGVRPNDWVSDIANLEATAGESFGLRIQAGSNSTDEALRVLAVDGTTNLFKVRGDGNVGIGTATPTRTLDVNGQAKVDQEFFSRNIVFEDSGSFGGNGVSIWSSATNYLNFETNDLPRMVIDSDGNVGIGTASPGNLLEVASTTTTAFIEANSGSTFDSGNILSKNGVPQWYLVNDHSASDTFSIRGNGGASDEFFVINQSGNVGIGTTTPDELLQVDGDAIFGDAASDGIKIAKNQSADVPSIIFYEGGVSEFLLEYRGNGAPGVQNIFRMGDPSGTDPVSIQYAGGNVGIGTASPDSLLHVRTASAGVTVSANADELFIENSANCGMTIGSGTSSLGNIFFADDNDGARGLITYDHSDNSLALGTDGTEHLNIDSSGNVGIGTASPNDLLQITGTGAAGISLDNTGTSGDRWRIVSTDSSIGIGGGRLGFFNADIGNYVLVLDDSDNVEVPSGTLTVTNQHRCKVEMTSGFTLTGSDTIDWTAEEYDIGSMHDTVTNNSRITIQEAGSYMFSLCVYMTSSGNFSQDDFFVSQITRYSSGDVALDTWIQSASIGSSTESTMYLNVSGVCYMDSGDYLEAFVVENAATTVTVQGTSGSNKTFMTVHKTT